MKLFQKQNLISLKNQKNQNQGFVILFAVVLTSIILSVSLGLADITYKEISFGTSAKNTGDAFFAADTGAECALYYDADVVATAEGPLQNPFGYNVQSFGAMSALECAGTKFSVPYSATTWEFILFNLGTSGKACAIVKVEKDISGGLINTKIISKGYNLGGDNESCFSDSPNKVEREIELTYSEEA